MNKNWYSAIGLFKDERENTNFIPQYEERTVLVRSSSIEDAEKSILQEFKDYSVDGITFLNEYSIRELYDIPGDEVVEVNSQSRVSDLSDKDFIEKYFNDLRPESCDIKNWKHYWYKKDDLSQACYNCNKIRKIR